MPVVLGQDICPQCVVAVDAEADRAFDFGQSWGFGRLAATATRGVCWLFWDKNTEQGVRRCVRCGRVRDWEDDRVAWGEPIDLQEMQAEFRNALEFTRQALAQEPSGPDDPRIIPHIIAAMATFGRDDTKAGSAWHLLHSLADDLPQENSEWELTLSAPPSWCAQASAAELLASTPAKERFEQEAQARIAASLGVEPHRVHITAVTEGSVHVKYTVADLTRAEKERILNGCSAELRAEFDTFVKLDISPAVLALHFNLSDLDERGHKSDFGQTFEIGPPGRTRTYHQPSGWSRYGFKVLGKYGDGDKWLTPFQDPGNWYRAFHGTRSGHEREIVDGGFRESTWGKLGGGVYVSPLVGYAEGYCRTLDLKLESGGKRFKCVLQVGVCPDRILKEGFPNKSGINQEWTVRAQDVRPYGLLIKEA